MLIFRREITKVRGTRRKKKKKRSLGIFLSHLWTETEGRRNHNPRQQAPWIENNYLKGSEDGGGGGDHFGRIRTRKAIWIQGTIACSAAWMTFFGEMTLIGKKKNQNQRIKGSEKWRSKITKANWPRNIIVRLGAWFKASPSIKNLSIVTSCASIFLSTFTFKAWEMTCYSISSFISFHFILFHFIFSFFLFFFWSPKHWHKWKNKSRRRKGKEEKYESIFHYHWMFSGSHKKINKIHHRIQVPLHSLDILQLFHQDNSHSFHHNLFIF